MKIPGIVYLLVGILITVVSSFIEDFTIFIVVGIFFTAIGIIKVVIGTGSKKEENKGKKGNRKIYKFVKCPNCSAFNYLDAERCHGCGGKMGGMIK